MPGRVPFWTAARTEPEFTAPVPVDRFLPDPLRFESVHPAAAREIANRDTRLAAK
jgi:hypothetical protein